MHGLHGQTRTTMTTGLLPLTSVCESHKLEEMERGLTSTGVFEPPNDSRIVVEAFLASLAHELDVLQVAISKVTQRR